MFLCDAVSVQDTDFPLSQNALDGVKNIMKCFSKVPPHVTACHQNNRFKFKFK